MILTPILILGIVLTAPGTGVGLNSLTEIKFLVVLGVVLVLAYSIVYVLLGTALPEIAERGKATLGEAFERGRSNFRVIAKALVFGPWVFGAGTMAAIFLAVREGVMVDLFNASTGAFQPAGLRQMLLLTSSIVFLEVLIAIVMVRAYRRYPVVSADVAAT